MGKMAIEYVTRSANIEGNIRHELIFSMTKKTFMRPAKSDRTNGRLIYYLSNGHYIKFSLFAFAPLNSAIFTLKNVYVNINGKIEENIILEYGMYYSEIGGILSDTKAPELLRKFIKMIPKPGVTHVDDSFRVNDVSRCIENIGRYLEEYLEENRRRQWESYDKVL